jgi:hypothetical protein
VGQVRAIDDLTFDHMQRLGATEEQMETALRESAGVPVEPLPTRRVPRLEETIEITSAWIVEDGEKSTLLLRDAAGDMWQVCDAGLGWSYHTEPGHPGSRRAARFGCPRCPLG